MLREVSSGNCLFYLSRFLIFNSFIHQFVYSFFFSEYINLGILFIYLLFIVFILPFSLSLFNGKDVDKDFNFYKELNSLLLRYDKSYENFKYTLNWADNIGVKNPPTSLLNS